MATFMGQKMSGRYSKEVDDLRVWLAERLPALGPFTMTRDDYQAGVDKLPQTHTELRREATNEWLTARDYELSYNQMCQAFFAAANDLKLLTVEADNDKTI